MTCETLQKKKKTEKNWNRWICLAYFSLFKSFARFSSARARVLSCKSCLTHAFMCSIPVQRRTTSATLRGPSDMPVMDEIVRDFKVAESSSESAAVFRQPGSGLPDKPLKTFNPVNSQCKSVCCTVLIHNWELSPCWVCLRQVKLESLRTEHYLRVGVSVCVQENTGIFFFFLFPHTTCVHLMWLLCVF